VLLIKFSEINKELIMKSYIQGFFTGGVFVFAIMVLMGQKQAISPAEETAQALLEMQAQIIEKSEETKVGKYQFGESLQRNFYILDTQTGVVYSCPKGLFTGDGQMHMSGEITPVSKPIE